MCAAAFGVAVLGGLATAGVADASTPRLTGDSSYGPCYYNPIPCNSAKQGNTNPYANPPLPNSKPDNAPVTRH